MCSGSAFRTLRYLALGDSYTLGESVSTDQCWPVQLVALLRERGFLIDEPTIVAQTGWTTYELLAGTGQANPSGTFELVSLQTGVNNQYRGYDIEAYGNEFRTLVQWAIAFAGGDADRVIVLSIPDWGVTPFAEGCNRGQIAQEIDRFNAVNRAEASQVGACYVDVTSVSRNVAEDRTFVAVDGLHPSERMYQVWAHLVLPVALGALGGKASSNSRQE
jgi:lysophospholipase L1-like esterase